MGAPEPSEEVDKVTHQLKKLQIESAPKCINRKKSDSLDTCTKAKCTVHDLGGNVCIPEGPTSDRMQHFIEMSTLH